MYKIESGRGGVSLVSTSFWFLFHFEEEYREGQEKPFEFRKTLGYYLDSYLYNEGQMICSISLGLSFLVYEKRIKILSSGLL